MVTDVALEGATAVAEQITGAGGTAMAFMIDCVDSGTLSEGVDEAAALLGGLDFIDHNAG